MSHNDADEIRNTAALFINRSRSMSYRGGGSYGGQPGHFQPIYDINRAHSINLITEEFLGGYMQDGRMSVVRRFFCLFVTFDLVFVALLWLISIMINGDNIFQAFHKQIVHYTIYTSLFDVVAAAVCRFVVLIFFYAFLYVNHWFIIAWVQSSQQVLEVILIMTSFVLAWGEAWFLDCRVIPQERHARRYFTDAMPADRSPVMAPFLASRNEPESAANFYSPLDSAPDSDAEEEEDEEYHQMGLDCVRKAYELLESADWKVEKVTPKGDTIRSTQREKLGRVYRLTGRIKCSAKAMLEELFYKIEEIPKWNPTLLESKIVRKVNSYTDITYQATVGAGGGFVKSRDFVNLRCWRLYRNGKMVDDHNLIDSETAATSDDENLLNRSYTASVSTVSEGESMAVISSSVEATTGYGIHTKPPTAISNSEASLSKAPHSRTLSQSLGAQDFNICMNLDEPPPFEEETFEDAKDNLDVVHKDAACVPPLKSAPASLKSQKDVVWLSAAISIDYPKLSSSNTKYIRGENLVSGFALREIDGKSDACIFEWLLCLDLKGYIPRYVLEAAYTSFMTDYMIYLRKYVAEMRHNRKKVPRN